MTASAGELAEFASNDVMDSFLDSVDAYLGDSEENLLEKIDQFFDKAGSELGLSSDAIAQAKEQLSSRVENFFDKVESSISALKDQVFGQSAQSAPGPESLTFNPIQTANDQPIPDQPTMNQRLAFDPNLEFLNAMIDALDTLDKEPVDSSDLLNPDGVTLKEPEEALSKVVG